MHRTPTAPTAGEDWVALTGATLPVAAAAAFVALPHCGAVVTFTGSLGVGEAAEVVAVSGPHRAAAFEAARFAIDELKRTVPIWKREAWQGGEAWGLEAQPLAEITGPPL